MLPLKLDSVTGQFDAAFHAEFINWDLASTHIIGKLARFRIVGRNTVTGTDPKFPVVSGNYRIDIIVAQPLDGRQPLHNAFFFVKATKTSTESTDPDSPLPILYDITYLVVV